MRWWWLVLALLVTGCAKKKVDVSPLDAALAGFEAQTGVRAHVHGPDLDMPEVGPRIAYGPPDPDKVLEVLPTVTATFLMYPEAFRLQLLRDLHLVGELRVGGTAVLGMAHPKRKWFDLAVYPGSKLPNVVQTIHHELAHQVMGLPGFDKATWAALGKGTYVGGPGSKQWGPGTPYLEAGFVTRYASKNAQEDFAELVEIAFAHPDRVRRLYDKHPALAAKLEFMTTQYRTLAPGMVLPWFGAGWEAWRAANPVKKRRRPAS